MKERKVIWFINKDAAPLEYYATHTRTVKLAQYFQDNGYDVKLFCSSFVHNRDINLIESNKSYIEKEYNNIPFIFIKTNKKSSNGIKRMINYFLFAYKILKNKSEFIKPDIIIHSPRIPFDFLICYLAKKLKVKYIIDITDLWPEAFERFGLVSSQNIILKLFYKIEYIIYSKGDHLVFSMEGGKEYLEYKKWSVEKGGKIDLSKVHYINNGVDLKEFDSNLLKYYIEDDDLSNEITFKIIYLGTIRFVNNLKQVIDVAQILSEYKNIVFLIYGDGEERKEMEQYCFDNKIKNVKFKNKWIDPKYVPSILTRASINLLNYGENSGKYGGSMNKMFLSLASGKPLICNSGMNYSIIQKYNLGIDKSFSSANEYAQAVLSIFNMETHSYVDICERVRKTAFEFDYNALCGLFAKECNI